jgi:translation initiation factor 1
LEVPDSELKLLAKQLKTLCSCGGAVKAGVIEIQGDHRRAIEQALKKQFPSVKIIRA